MILRPFGTDEPIFGGLDLSSTIDITAWCMVQRRDEGFIANWRFWMPKEEAEKAYRDHRVPYPHWAEQGLVSLTSGNSVDYEAVERDILEDVAEYSIREAGYDPWQAEGPRQRLDCRGLRMTKVPQQYAYLSEPMKVLKKCVVSGTLKHGGNLVADNHAEHLESRQDLNGNDRPVRPETKYRQSKIDGMVSLIIAIAIALRHPQSVASYEGLHVEQVIPEEEVERSRSAEQERRWWG